MSKKQSPKYLVVYQCGHCNQDSGYTENDKPVCRFCKRCDRMTMISKDRIKPKVVKARLQIVIDKMMGNLTKAYEELPDVGENIVAEGTDAESWLLRLMDKTKKLRDKVRRL